MKVIRNHLEDEEILPEDQRPTALARSYYLKVRFLFLFLVSYQSCTFTQPVRGLVGHSVKTIQMMHCLKIQVWNFLVRI